MITKAEIERQKEFLEPIIKETVKNVLLAHESEYKTPEEQEIEYIKQMNELAERYSKNKRTHD